MGEGGSKTFKATSNVLGSFPRIMIRISLGSCSPHKALLLSNDARRRPPAHAQASCEQLGCSFPRHVAHPAKKRR